MIIDVHTHLSTRDQWGKLFLEAFYAGRTDYSEIDMEVTPNLLRYRKGNLGQVTSLCRQLGPDDPHERLLMVSLRDHARDATYPDLRSDLTSAFQFLGLLGP